MAFHRRNDGEVCASCGEEEAVFFLPSGDGYCEICTEGEIDACLLCDNIGWIEDMEPAGDGSICMKCFHARS
jgi:hypothetical protein